MPASLLPSLINAESRQHRLRRALGVAFFLAFTIPAQPVFSGEAVPGVTQEQPGAERGAVAEASLLDIINRIIQVAENNAQIGNSGSDDPMAAVNAALRRQNLAPAKTDQTTVQTSPDQATTSRTAGGPPLSASPRQDLPISSANYRPLAHSGQAAAIEMYKKLNQRIDADYEEVPLKDVVADFSARTGLNVVFHAEVNREQPVTLQVKDMECAGVLRWALRLCNLKCVFRDEALFLVPNAWRSPLAMRIYDLSELVMPMRDFYPTRLASELNRNGDNANGDGNESRNR